MPIQGKEDRIINPKLIDHLAFQVRFRCVGQGDTILIEAGTSEHRYLGIIDCVNVKGQRNPITSYLDYLKLNKVKCTICFVVLTHPHEDHCSGVAELFEYIHENEIDVKTIAHEFDVHPQFFQTTGKVVPLIRSKIEKLQKFNRRLDVCSASLNIALEFSDITSAKFLAPDKSHTGRYIRDQRKNYDPCSRHYSAMANRLSAVIAFPYKKRFILLTSDVNAQELKKIVYRMENSSLKNHTMIAAQIPHHGSVRNFDSKSWARIRRIFTREKMEAVFSVAPNHRRHPSKIVIKVLKRLGYVIRRTDDAMKRSRKGMVNFNQRHAEESWEVDDEYYGEKDVIIPMDK